MTVYQFDQCFSDKQVIAKCNAQGLAQAIPIPTAWIGLKDPEFLRELLPTGRPLVTTDWALPEEHCSHIPDWHPGIVAIRYSVHAAHKVKKTMTTNGAARILTSFKNLFPEWNEIAVSNCIIYISEADVELSAVRSGRLCHLGFASFADTTGWPDQFRALISAQSSSNRQAISAAPIEFHP